MRRGLYEFGAYAFKGAYSNTRGMRFRDLSDPRNGMVTVWAIMAVEWAVFMVLAWYLEQVWAAVVHIELAIMAALYSSC